MRVQGLGRTAVQRIAEGYVVGSSWQGLFARLAIEPPFRILVRQFLKLLKPSVHTRALWELSPRPPYLIGMLAAAHQALRQGSKETKMYPAIDLRAGVLAKPDRDRALLPLQP